MLVINGQYPGPLIEANEGDTIVVNVQNDLPTGNGLRKCLCIPLGPACLPCLTNNVEL